MTDAPKRWQIVLTYYDDNWKEKSEVLHTGAIEDQMRNLFYTRKDRERITDKAIRMELIDKTGEVRETVEY